MVVFRLAVLNKVSSFALVDPVVFPAKQHDAMFYAALCLNDCIVRHFLKLRPVMQQASKLNAKLLISLKNKQSVHMCMYLCQGTECSGPN